jgi:hypothetical protein
MDDAQHLQTFSPEQNKQSKTQGTFNLFPQLIVELRLKIWHYAFQRQRIVTVHLQPGEERIVDGKLEWIWGDPHSTALQQPYGIFVSGYRLMNKFLRVCQESRAEVLRFYRVHIPCRFATEPEGVSVAIGLDKTKPGILYLNPEHDFLHIIGVLAPFMMPEMFLVDFAVRLKRDFDPHHVGLLNLVLDGADINRLIPNNNSYSRSQPIPTLFQETIDQLQEFWLLNRQTYGRVNLSLLSGVWSTDSLFTRSFPLMPLTPTFELLGPDPRPISHELSRLNIDNLSSYLATWLLVLGNLGIKLGRNTRYRYLVAQEAYMVYNREIAKNLLEKEDYRWRNPEIEKGKTVELEDLEKAVKPAFGFWLFPGDAFGSFGINGAPAPQGDLNGREYKDLSKFYPKLALSVLP